MKKLKIELTPYAALSILKFLSEFESDMEREPKLTVFKECCNEFKNEVTNKISMEQLEDAVMQTNINQALGTDPLSKLNGG